MPEPLGRRRLPPSGEKGPGRARGGAPCVPPASARARRRCERAKRRAWLGRLPQKSWGGSTRAQGRLFRAAVRERRTSVKGRRTRVLDKDRLAGGEGAMWTSAHPSSPAAAPAPRGAGVRAASEGAHPVSPSSATPAARRALLAARGRGGIGRAATLHASRPTFPFAAIGSHRVRIQFRSGLVDARGRPWGPPAPGVHTSRPREEEGSDWEDDGRIPADGRCLCHTHCRRAIRVAIGAA